MVPGPAAAVVMGEARGRERGGGGTCDEVGVDRVDVADRYPYNDPSGKR